MPRALKVTGRSRSHRDVGRRRCLVLLGGALAGGPLAGGPLAGGPLAGGPLLTVIRPPTVLAQEAQPVEPPAETLPTGRLRDLAPALAALPEAEIVEFHQSWDGLSPAAPWSATYLFRRRGDQFEGMATFEAGGNWRAPRKTQRETSLPLADGQELLLRLADIWAIEKPYVPARRWTDDYPFVSLRAQFRTSAARFYTRSQGEDFIPWAVQFEERTFVVETSAVADTLELLTPALHPDVLRELRREVEASAPRGR